MRDQKKTRILPRNPSLGCPILPPAVMARQVTRLLRKYSEARAGGRVLLSDRLIERVNDGIESIRMVQRIRRCLEHGGQLPRLAPLRPSELDVSVLMQARARLLAPYPDGSAILDESLVAAVDEAIGWAKETDWSLMEIQVDPVDPLDFRSRGTAYCHLGLHLQAVGDFTRAIELLPSTGYLYASRARCLYEHLRDYEGALIDIGAVIHFHIEELDPCSAMDYLTRSKILWDCGRHDEALRSLEEFTRRIDRVFRETAWSPRGVGYLGDDIRYDGWLLREYLEEGIEHAERLRSIAPGVESLRESLANILEQM